MTTIKSFTDISQSKKLAEILPLESADMCCFENQDGSCNYYGFPYTQANKAANPIPLWSLAALLEQLPYEVIDDDGNSVYLQIDKEDDVYQLVYTDPCGDFESIETDRYEHFIDACVDIIGKLHELKML